MMIIFNLFKIDLIEDAFAFSQFFGPFIVNAIQFELSTWERNTEIICFKKNKPNCRPINVHILASCMTWLNRE